MSTALIVGGGIAGPVAAMALQRAGIDAAIHEARPAPVADIGAWLGLQTNGLDALRAIDADSEAATLGVATSSIALATARAGGWGRSRPVGPSRAVIPGGR